ncbi:MAG TPA: hypothetical protein VJP45_01900 [Candidatus Limnocylindria bacterium]|nr:hypothetical protein [Candidatus Limnocylindria bacterium]
MIRRAAEIGYVFVTLADIERTRRTKRALGPRRNVAFPQHVRGRVEALGFGTLADRLNAMIAHGLAVLDPRPPLERY